MDQRRNGSWAKLHSIAAPCDDLAKIPGLRFNGAGARQLPLKELSQNDSGRARVARRCLVADFIANLVLLPCLLQGPSRRPL